MNRVRQLHRRKTRQGMSLLVVLILIVAITIIAFGASVAVYTDVQVGKNAKLAEQATFLAETGVEMMWHDFRWAPDVSPADGQIDVVPGVNDMDNDGEVDFFTVFEKGNDLGSASSPITLVSSSTKQIVAWVEANQPGPGRCIVHATGQVMIGTKVLARKAVDLRVDNTAGKVIQGTINNAWPCGLP